jgi:zinc protease
MPTGFISAPLLFGTVTASGASSNQSQMRKPLLFGRTLVQQEPADTLLLANPSTVDASSVKETAVKNKAVGLIAVKQTPFPKLTYTELAPHVDPVIGKTRVFQFSNGMKFYALQRHEVPLVSWGELYDTGSVKEENWNNGVAHFLEHLIFKGTDKVKPGEFDRGLENLGAGINAWTTYNHTFYFLNNMPKEGLPEAIKLRAEVVQNASIPPEELEKERGAVLEEINMIKNNKLTKVFRSLSKMLWEGSPYQRSLWGPTSNIRNLKREEILDFYARHYGPNKRSIIAVGDFNLPETLELIATHYNHPFPPQGTSFPKNLGTLKHSRDNEPLKSIPKQSQRFVEDPDVTVAIAAHGFDGPLPGEPGAARKLMALEMLGIILGGDESSRLHHNLVEKEKLTTSIGMGIQTLKQRSAILVSFQSKPEDREAVSKRIREHLEAVVREGVTVSEMTKVKTMMESALASGLETSNSLFNTLAWGLGDNKLDRIGGKGLALLQSITNEEIQSVAKAYLGAEREKIAGLIPPGHKKTEEISSKLTNDLEKTITSAAHVRFGGRLHPMDKALKLPGGTELIVREKLNSPSTSISLLIKGGNWADGNVPGLVDHLADWLQRGTKELSATDLQKMLAEKGMALGISASTDALHITMSGLTRSAEEMFKILGDILSKPAFVANELDFVKTLRREGHQASSDISPSYVLGELMEETLYPANHPYGLSQGRIVAAAHRATPVLVQQAYQQLFHPSNMTIGVSGGVSLQQVRAWSEPLLAALPHGSGTIPKGVKPPEIKVNRIVTLPREGVKQAELLQAWSTPGVRDVDRVPLAMLSRILSGGRNSRLFQRFREQEKSLCYDVSAQYNAMQDGGDFRFYIGTDPKNLSKVQHVFQEELEKLIGKEPPSAEEMARNRKLLKSIILASAESNGVVSGSVAKHRAFDNLSVEEFAERIDQVTPKQVQEMAAKYLVGKPSITAIVAPEAALKEHGLPITKPAEKIKAKL